MSSKKLCDGRELFPCRYFQNKNGVAIYFNGRLAFGFSLANAFSTCRGVSGKYQMSTDVFVGMISDGLVAVRGNNTTDFNSCGVDWIEVNDHFDLIPKT